MIQFEYNNSSIYLANKAYCDLIESDFLRLNANYSGYCSAYGYNVKGSFSKGGLNYHFEFKKSQSTQAPSIINFEGIDSADIVIIIKGIKSHSRIKIGKSILKRLFSPLPKKEWFLLHFILRGWRLPIP